MFKVMGLSKCRQGEESSERGNASIIKDAFHSGPKLPGNQEEGFEHGHEGFLDYGKE